MKQDKLFFVTLLFLFLKGFVIQLFGNFDLFNLLADFLVIVCAIKTPKLPYRNLIQITGKVIIYSLSLFLIVGVFSDLLNLVPIKTTLWGVKNFIRYFLLAYAVLGRYRNLRVDNFKKLIYNLFFLNILAVIFDYSTNRVGDAMGGIFLGNGDLAIFLVISLLFFSSDYMLGKKNVCSLIGAYVVSFSIAMLAEIKFLYFMIPLCLCLSYVFVRKMTVLNVLLFSIVCFFWTPTLKYALSFYYDQNYIENIFDEDERDEYLEGDGYNLGMADVGFNRNTCVEKAQILFLKDMQTSLVGYGIGSASNSSTFGTWIAEKYRFTAYFFFTSSFVLIETGWIGYILFLSIYLFIMLRFLYFYFKARDAHAKYWAAIGTMMGIMTFMFIWYNSAPYVDYYLPFMLWGFCILGIFKSKAVKR